jgi:hypothetical protein
MPLVFRPTRLNEALEPLERLYTETSKPDEAAKWHKEMEAQKAAAKSAGGSRKEKD